MSKHDSKITLLQIAECAKRAQEPCSGTTLDELVSDWRSVLAFERVLEVLGEAAKRLPPELRERYPAVPWKLVAGMRDRVSHGYDAIDYKRSGTPCSRISRRSLRRSRRCFVNWKLLQNHDCHRLAGSGRCRTIHTHRSR